MNNFIKAMNISILAISIGTTTLAMRRTKKTSQPQTVLLANVKLTKIQNDSKTPIKVSLETSKKYSYNLQGNQSVMVDEEFNVANLQKFEVAAKDQTKNFRDKLNKVRQTKKGDVSVTLRVKSAEDFDLK